MRTFSRIAFICNICFIISAILRVVELTKRAHGNNNAAIPLPAVEGTIVILGFIAIFINVVFFLAFLVSKISNKTNSIPKFILWFNILLIPVEIWYSFFSNIIR